MTELTGPTNLIEGQSAHMEARIEPYPDANMKVEWFHNGKPLAMGKQRRGCCIAQRKLAHLLCLDHTLLGWLLVGFVN